MGEGKGGGTSSDRSFYLGNNEPQAFKKKKKTIRVKIARYSGIREGDAQQSGIEDEKKKINPFSRLREKAATSGEGGEYER